MATITSQTYDFVPEIWNEIKEYAGVFPLPANIIHFDKLTFDELEDNISKTSWDAEENAFGMLGIDNVYAALVWGVTDECREDDADPLLEYSGGKYFDFGKVVNNKEKKEMLINVIFCEYKSRKEYWVFLEKKEFWNGVSELITNCFQKREEKKIAAAWGRKKNKEFKETVKGMTQEIIKMEEEERKLVERMEKDAEKLKKLKAKRGKLEKKREEKYGN
tara:strand:+ start:165 stop:821 length:657 start_codon:yes stop_codon:yes gene_type:complete